MAIISYPTPLYQNFPINSDYYYPSFSIISALSLGQTTTVTTTANHEFVIGQLVRLLIPIGYGSRTLNEKQAIVINIPTTTEVELNISSYDTTTFINAGSDAQILPIGDINSGVINSNGSQNLQTYIDGSFINISPE